MTENEISRETHIDDELGLFIPQDLREFESQIVFRTPRATIQHFGSQPLDGYYGMIHADQFGDPGEMSDPKNPDLAPNRVKIKPQGEEPVTLTVETEPEIRTDGGVEAIPETIREQFKYQPVYCPECELPVSVSIGDEHPKDIRWECSCAVGGPAETLPDHWILPKPGDDR